MKNRVAYKKMCSTLLVETDRNCHNLKTFWVGVDHKVDTREMANLGVTKKYWSKIIEIIEKWLKSAWKSKKLAETSLTCGNNPC